ncbi:MAG: class I SAM-dependent methyltransferase [Myxococcota bacterium]|nr:class I SAM-dependent methyltransferase [Myxococcota bacterium]
MNPNVAFTGVDFSATELAAARARVEAQGLSQVELIQGDFRDVEVEAGAYDLVLCHGTFSWVPDDAKQRIFELCHQALKPTGLAAIVYLTYPGWKQREAIRLCEQSLPGLTFRVPQLEGSELEFEGDDSVRMESLHGYPVMVSGRAAVRLVTGLSETPDTPQPFSVVEAMMKAEGVGAEALTPFLMGLLRGGALDPYYPVG